MAKKKTTNETKANEKRPDTSQSRSTVDGETFVRTWQQASTAEEVAETLSVSVSNASSRASRFRKKGVPLKKFVQRGGPHCDWDALADLAKQYND